MFGLIGYVAFRFGRKQGRAATMWTGVVLMVYPYVVSNTWLLYGIGFVLCGALWWQRD